MKIHIFRIILFLNAIFTATSYSQDYEAVDRIIDKYPNELATTEELAGLIKRDFSKPDEKARAIFRWVAANISYDIDMPEFRDGKSINAFSYSSEKEKLVREKKFKTDLTLRTWKTRKAVCHGYAVLVEHLCTLAGIEAETIIGVLKSEPSQIGIFPAEVNHAWNAVKINNEWKFIDATLGAGFISDNTGKFKFHFNDSYFFTTPERFFLNHYPADEKWLFTSKNKKEFATLPLFFGNYLQNNYQIITPLNGVYSIKEKGDFVLSIKGLQPYDGIDYAFTSDNKMVYIEQEDNTKNFTIPLAGKAGSYLFIYINRNIIAVYKITD